MGTGVDFEALLRDKDAVTLIAGQLTRREAGRTLARVCKFGAFFVREADKRESGGARCMAVWRTEQPMWSLERTYARLDKRHGKIEGGGLFSVELVLRSLAEEIELLRQDDVCELEFDVVKACVGKKPCLLGCHVLYVLDPVQFLVRLERWLAAEGAKDASKEFLGKICAQSASLTLLTLFSVLQLKRPGGRGSRFQHDPERFKGHGAVSESEPLWHQRYVAM